MTINSALANSYSGLTANTRLSEIVSRNVANAATDGYAARSVTLSNRVIADVGSGVLTSAPNRAGDAFLTADRRQSEARSESERVTAEAMRKISNMVAPGEGQASLADRYEKLDVALRALAETPESVAIQAQVLDAANSVARTLQELSAGAQSLRLEADTSVARQVEAVNRALARIESLNGEIVTARATGRDATALEDERDRQIDVVNGIVPIKASAREGGRVALYTNGGGLLIDGKARTLEFERSSTVTDADTLGSGSLSDVTFLGKPAAPTAPTNSAALAGGSLEAAFRVRDEVGVEFAAQLDALATDLIERFQDPAVVGAIGAGEGGLFIDEGVGGPFVDLAATPEQQVGLAARILVNPTVDPSQGGALRRLRDGVNSAAAGLEGDATLPAAMVDAFTASRVARAPVSPDSAFPTVTSLDPTGFDVARSTIGRVESIMALRELGAQTAEQSAAFAGGAFAATQEAELRVTAVDTDKELRDLLAIEKAYAANARVLQVVDGLIGRLLEI